MQEPLLHLLHRRYGKPCGLLGFSHWPKALFEGSPDVGTIWQLRRRHVPYLLSPERRALVRELALHEGPVYISEDIPLHVQRIGKLLISARIPPDRCISLLDHHGDVSASHWVDRLLALGRLTPAAWNASDYPVKENDVRRAPVLQVSQSDVADCGAWLHSRRLDGAPLVLLQPGNKRTSRHIASRQRHDSKAWPAERWIALVDAIQKTSESLRVILCGSAQERTMLDEIGSNCANIVVATHDLPVRRLLALAQHAHSMIGVDTGPMHAAVAVGCPVVILYGAEAPTRWDRRSPSGHAVINLGGPPRTSVSEITLDEVLRAWRCIDGDRRAVSWQGGEGSLGGVEEAIFQLGALRRLGEP